MNPFVVFELDRDATDDEVEERYRELLRDHPPDRDPEAFALVRGAYDALRSRRCRLKSWLFYFDQYGRSLSATRPRIGGPSLRRRIELTELTAAIGSSLDHEAL